jgi:hypothetical protein
MNLLTYLYFIFQHEESLRREEEVEATRLEEEEVEAGGGLRRGWRTRLRGGGG